MAPWRSRPACRSSRCGSRTRDDSYAITPHQGPRPGDLGGRNRHDHTLRAVANDLDRALQQGPAGQDDECLWPKSQSGPAARGLDERLKGHRPFAISDGCHRPFEKSHS
jgi:hypothetical protein